MSAAPELTINPMDLHREFAATLYGQKLAGEIRYARFNLGNMPNESWIRMLGPDVNNLMHMPLTYGLANDFMRVTEQAQPGLLSTAEKQLVRVGAITHDWGEAIIPDISFSDKTEEDDRQEAEAFQENLAGFVPNLSVATRQYIGHVASEVVHDHETPAGRVLNAVERVGYMRTALRANRYLYRQLRFSKGLDLAGFRWLVADVLLNQTLALANYARDYSPVDCYLKAKSAEIGTAFMIVEPEDFDNYGNQTKQKMDKFEATKRTWGSWVLAQK